MWRSHPENAGALAWSDLLDTLEQLRISAANAGVTLGIEPEPTNVISSPDLAYELLVTHGPKNLGIVLDVANLLGANDRHRQGDMIRHAVDLLAPWIVATHAKDRDDSCHRPPGAGWIDWDLCFSMLSARAFSGPVVIHGIAPANSARAREYVATVIERHFAPPLGAV
jgi:sugar phosphate isomerase/epimerase